MKKTLKGMMMKSLFFFCIIPFSFLWLSFAVSSGMSLKKNIENEQRTIVRLMNLSVENYFSKMEELMGRIASDSQVRHILKKVNRTRYGSEVYNAYQYIERLVGTTCFSYTGLENVIITNASGGYYNTSTLDMGIAQYVSDVERTEEERFQHKGNTWVRGFQKESGEKVLLLINPILDMENMEFIGTIYFVIEPEEMAELLQGNMSSGDELLLLDDQGEVLYEENQQEKERLWSVETQSQSNRYGTSVVTEVSVLKHGSQLFVRQILIFLIFVVVTSLMVILILYIYRTIKEEISNLLIPNGKGERKDTTYFEIKQINHEMMSLMQKNSEGEKKIVRLMNHCDTITLDKLQAQINPHFLYNTLTSIKYIAMENGQKEISMLITALIKLLRSTINREGSFVTLAKELESVNYYMRIQNVIYKGNIEFQITVPETMRECLVPNFILQPLVENCLFHGIHPEEKGGKVEIEVKRTAKGMSIFISDNGDGFAEDSLEKIMGAENHREMMTNFGLKGVQQKIQLLCGENYGLSVVSTKKIGSTVEINLPDQMKGGTDHVESNDRR